MHLHRVLAILTLAVATGIALIWVEGQNLRLNQKLSELNREQELLAEEQARLRLAVSRMAAPLHVLSQLEGEEEPLQEPKLPVVNQPRATVPLYLQR